MEKTELVTILKNHLTSEQKIDLLFKEINQFPIHDDEDFKRVSRCNSIILGEDLP